MSLIVVAVSMATGLAVGTALGLIGGWFGGLTDEIIMRMVDIWAAVPFLLVALVVAVVLGIEPGDHDGVAGAIGVVGIRA